MSGGAIQNVLVSVDNDGYKVSEESGAVPLTGAEFTMTGGTIHDAGGILVQGENAVFTLKGGAITGIRNGGLVPAAVFVADGGTFAMAGGEIRDSSLAAVAVGTNEGPSAQPAAFSLANGTIRDAFGSLSEREPSSSVVIGGLGSFAMSGGHIAFSKESGSAPDRAVSALPGASFLMTGGEIAGVAKTGVAVECADFEMTGGTLNGMQVGVTVSGGGTSNGAFVLNGGSISGCEETGVAVYKLGELALVDGAVRNNPGAIAIDVQGGNANIMSGTITNNKCGVRIADGSCALSGGMIAGNGETDVDVLTGEGSGKPPFILSSLAGIETVRLGENAVIHVGGLLEDGAGIVVDAASGLGSVITAGLAGNGRAEQFVSKNDALSAFANEKGEAVFAYAVYFDSGKGTPVDPQFILADGQYAEKPADPTLANARFEDWYLNGVKYDFWTVVERSLTLEAKWTYESMRDTDFALPSSLTVIQAYALSGIQRKAIALPAAEAGEAQNARVIRKDAFAGCQYLQVLIPAGWRIEDGAFDGCREVILYGPEGGAASHYAEKYPDNCSFSLAD